MLFTFRPPPSTSLEPGVGPPSNFDDKIEKRKKFEGTNFKKIKNFEG
jgi:hypothetical protein